MSDDGNPNDAALERGDNSDVTSLPGFRGHGPKLSRESRAINPRAQLAAEAEGQSLERHAYDEMSARGHMPVEQMYQRGSPPPDPYARAPMMRQPSTLPRGMPRVVPPPMRQPAAPPPPVPQGITDAEAWDSYVLAVLPVLMAEFPDHGASALIPHAAMIADEVLEERRRRFA